MRGDTPTMEEQAMALERREKETVRPARDSWSAVGVVGVILSLVEVI